MRTRRFRGKDLRETLDKIKAALGEDAIIVSTRKVSRGDFGLAGGSLVEVEATNPEMESADPVPFGDEGLEACDERADEMGPAVDEGVLPGPMAETESPYSDLFYELSESGIEEETAREILSRAERENGDSRNGSLASHRKQVAKILSLLFDLKGPVRIRQMGDEGPAISNFIGPTGAGKSSTIAKIAAQCTRKKLRVGLITLDTHRAGGSEYMKFLANLLRLPLITAGSKKQLDQALAKFRRADVVLVDSPGMSIGDEAGMAELDRIFGKGRPGDNYLVLAANTHSEDLKRMGESFSRTGLDGLIFTKLDEASRFGVIFEVHMNLGVPLSYLTAGQKIPGDLEVAAPEKLARLVLPVAPEYAPAEGVAI
ncbi:MAG TPA: hypothetical protein DDZ83_18375 [Nitrospinae bacterium]|nr:hypothetical protein [Nitrospinota bacterium]